LGRGGTSRRSPQRSNGGRLMKQAGHVDPRTTTESVEDAERMETTQARMGVVTPAREQSQPHDLGIVKLI
jgi:hypothetical protein